MRYPPLCVLLLSLIACSPRTNRPQVSRSSAAEGVDSSSDHAGLDSTEGRFLAAYNRKDLEGILGTYADDIRFVLEGEILDGKQAVRQAWQRSLPRLSGLSFKSVAQTARGDLGVVLESFTQRLRESGKPEQTDSGYSLAVLRRQSDGQWLYATVMLSRAPAKPATGTRGK